MTQPEHEHASIADLAALREAAYRLLASFFLYPDDAEVAAARDAASRLEREAHWAADFTFHGPWERFLRLVLALEGPAVSELQGRYLALFSGTTGEAPIPLCESGFLDRSAFDDGRVFASLQAHYASAGVAPASEGGETPDHIAVELEFLSLLCGREADAWEAGDRREARRAGNRARRFMEQHTMNWLPLLARAVSDRDSGLYAASAEAASSLVAHDIDFLKALRAHLRAAPGGDGTGSEAEAGETGD